MKRKRSKEPQGQEENDMETQKEHVDYKWIPHHFPHQQVACGMPHQYKYMYVCMHVCILKEVCSQNLNFVIAWSYKLQMI